MWILTSLARPDRIRRVVSTYAWGGESQVVLALWEGDTRLPEYRASEWPESWKIEIVPMRGNGPTYNEILRRYPGEKCYGFLADDVVLDVQGMLRMLETAAGDWGVTYPNDGIQGERLCTMPCLGGELVRAVGYLSPAKIIHWAIDNIWYEIGRQLGTLRYMPELSYTHLHHLNGKALMDRTYHEATIASMGWENFYRQWLLDGEARRVIGAARNRMDARKVA